MSVRDSTELFANVEFLSHLTNSIKVIFILYNVFQHLLLWPVVIWMQLYTDMLGLTSQWWLASVGVRRVYLFDLDLDLDLDHDHAV